MYFRGVKLMYLPPYSPDFNLIEECFSYMKSMLRRYGTQFCEVLDSKKEMVIMAFISNTLATVTPQHTQGWFHHSNYM
ncbi:putative transposase of insertion sequence [Ramaria rubella]|nr:putative transposase of insertion sequence [Ramaria rubella]